MGNLFDPVVPSPGETLFYLATTVVLATESDLGAMSDGATRPNANPCP